MRLIDADELMKEIKSSFCKACIKYCRSCDIDDFISYIDDASTIDAIPLINGHWIDLSRINQLLNTNVPVVHCHHCGISFIGLADSKGFVYKYCPHCGKRTDGDKE